VLIFVYIECKPISGRDKDKTHLLRTKSVPRLHHPRSMLASPLRHSRIKFAPSPPLYPASHAANLQVYLIPNPGNPVVLFLPWSEQRAKKKRRRSIKKLAKLIFFDKTKRQDRRRYCITTESVTGICLGRNFTGYCVN
ncbi:MAG: hypothetical protein WBJ59_03975, partial [Dysgonamonadaceae bacterium]